MQLLLSLLISAFAGIFTVSVADPTLLKAPGFLDAITGLSQELRLPEVTLEGLLARSPAEVSAARNALSQLGALAVVGASSTASNALSAWAKCLSPGGPLRDSSLIRTLARGKMRRVSVTAGGRWESTLPKLPDCQTASQDTDAMRFSVRAATRALLQAVGDTGSLSVDLRLPSGAKQATSLADAVDAASHLEHLHLYEEVQNVSLDPSPSPALDLHTDAGLLLAFVPPVSATRGGLQVHVEVAGGNLVPLAPLPDGSVVFFVGEAAKMLWQSRSQPLRPLPHSLSLAAGFGWRAWYGTMLLLPENLLIRADWQNQGGMENAATFGSFWHSAQRQLSGSHSDAQDVSLACGRGLKLVDQAGACPAGQMSCWMTCMSIEGFDHCKGGAWRVNGDSGAAQWEGYSLQCRDTQTGKKWPDQTGSMCPKCKPACTVEGGAQNGSSPPHPPDSPATSFCMTDAGGTTMYMDGFKWTAAAPHAACLNFLWPGFTIDTWYKLVAACIATIGIASMVELVTLARRLLPTQRQQDLGLCFYGASLAFAYVAMLFIMTYSLELFFSVLVGLVLGHVITKKCSGAKDARTVDLGAAGGGGAPCCRLAHGLDPSMDLPLLSTPHRLVSLRISGMTCNTCVGAVQSSLSNVCGVRSVRVTLEPNHAQVICNSSISIEDLCETVRAIGFNADVSNGE